MKRISLFLDKMFKVQFIKIFTSKEVFLQNLVFLFEHVYQEDGAFALKEDHHLTKSLRFHYQW